MSAATTSPWWQTSLKITAVVVAVAMVAVFAPWPINGVAVVAGLTFLLVSWINPDYWLRRLSKTCITGAAASAAIPSISGELQVELGFLRGPLEFGNSTGLWYAVLGVGVVLAGLDVWRERSATREAEPEILAERIKDPFEDHVDDQGTKRELMRSTSAHAFESKVGLDATGYGVVGRRACSARGQFIAARSGQGQVLDLRTR